MCPKCGSQRFGRKRRRLLDRLLYAAVYWCDDCGMLAKVFHSSDWHWFSRTAQCPRCGNPEVTRQSRLDQIEGLYRNPISRIQQLLHAPLYHCMFCRLQFYDWRPRAGKVRKGPPGYSLTI